MKKGLHSKTLSLRRAAELGYLSFKNEKPSVANPPTPPRQLTYRQLIGRVTELLLEETSWRAGTKGLRLISITFKRHGTGLSARAVFLGKKKKQFSYWESSSDGRSLLWNLFLKMKQGKIKLSPNRYPIDLDKMDI